MNYEKASDFELSAAIIETMDGGLLSKPYPTTKSESNARADCGGVHYMNFDINNWADVGPLIVEHEITILFYGDGVEVSYAFEGVESVHGTDETLSYHISGNKKDVLRLVAICYLKMKEQEL